MKRKKIKKVGVNKSVIGLVILIIILGIIFAYSSYYNYKNKVNDPLNSSNESNNISSYDPLDNFTNSTNITNNSQENNVTKDNFQENKEYPDYNYSKPERHTSGENCITCSSGGGGSSSQDNTDTQNNPVILNNSSSETNQSNNTVNNSDKNNSIFNDSINRTNNQTFSNNTTPENKNNSINNTQNQTNNTFNNSIINNTIEINKTIDNISNEPLIYQNNLVYLGAFRVPLGNPGANYTFDYASTGFAFNPSGNNGKGSLFINNHIYEQLTSEITIPELSKDINNLSIAEFLQNFSDITEGNRVKIGENRSSADTSGATIGGLILYQNKIIGSVFGNYDANNLAYFSHFTSSLNLSQKGDFKGMYRLGEINPGFVGGYMTEIPKDYQSKLGGDILTGQGALSIISRTSLGPSAFAFNASDLGTKNPVPIFPLLYYDINHATLGNYSSGAANANGFNMGMSINGVIFPPGTSSVLFFGRTGLGPQCYGCGCSNGTVGNPSCTPNNDCPDFCYDPVISSKGGHAYPYSYYVWAYDVNDLILVKDGLKNPWDIKPYSTFELNLSMNGKIPLGNDAIQGVSYDPVKKRLYVSQSYAEAYVPGVGEYDARPLIQVFEINVSV